jgi:outer membrane protein assembly factor BamB
MKKSILTFAAILGFAINNISIAQIPNINWWYNTNDFSAGQATARDIDNDGKYEIVFSCYRNDSTIYALNAENGTLLWKKSTRPSSPGAQGCNDVAPIIYDVDNDGQLDVIVPSSCNPKTFCYDGATGALKWVCNTRGSDSPPTIADIDNDGKAEIIHGEFNGYVICINAENGTVAWEILADGNSWVQTAPTIVDLDNDGQLDFVIGTYNFNTKDSVFAYRGNNQTRMWARAIHGHMYHGTAVDDFDFDGKPELVIGSQNDTLYCLNGENGTVAWKYRGMGGTSWAPVSLGDIDNDGSCDVVFVSNYKVIALSNTGVFKWEYNTPNFSEVFRGVALADITNDNYLDVIFGTNNGKLITLNGNNGSLIWSLDLRAHHGNTLFSLDHAPIVADFDNDDTLDIFIAGGYGDITLTNNFGRAYMVSAGKGKGPNYLMFHRDIRRKSTLCNYVFPNPTDINETEITPMTSLNVFPNPANTQATFRFSNKSNFIQTLIIFN